ncbi:MAG: hypothetical protein WCG28_02895 [bacterium]
MDKIKQKTYTIQEVQESLDHYLDSSSERLRLRLKTAWKKQTFTKQPLSLYDKVKI